MKNENLPKFTPLNAEDQRKHCRLLMKLQEENLGHWEPLRNCFSLSIRISKTFGNGTPLQPSREELTEIIKKFQELKEELEGEI